MEKQTLTIQHKEIFGNALKSLKIYIFNLIISIFRNCVLRKTDKYTKIFLALLLIIANTNKFKFGVTGNYWKNYLPIHRSYPLKNPEVNVHYLYKCAYASLLKEQVTKYYVYESTFVKNIQKYWENTYFLNSSLEWWIYGVRFSISVGICVTFFSEHALFANKDVGMRHTHKISTVDIIALAQLQEWWPSHPGIWWNCSKFKPKLPNWRRKPAYIPIRITMNSLLLSAA